VRTVRGKDRDEDELRRRMKSVDELATRLQRYFEELGSKPLEEILAEVRREDPVVKQSFAYLLLASVCEGLEMNTEEILMVLEHARFELMLSAFARADATTLARVEELLSRRRRK
jgi:hypothetical protein